MDHAHYHAVVNRSTSSVSVARCYSVKTPCRPTADNIMAAGVGIAGNSSSSCMVGIDEAVTCTELSPRPGVLKSSDLPRQEHDVVVSTQPDSTGLKDSDTTKPRQARPKKNNHIDEIYIYVMTKKYPPGLTKACKRSLRAACIKYLNIQGQLYYRFLKGRLLKVVRDKAEQQNIIERIHTDPDAKNRTKHSHWNLNKTRSKVLEQFFWPGIGHDVRAFILSCKLCISETAIEPDVKGKDHMFDSLEDALQYLDYSDSVTSLAKSQRVSNNIELLNQAPSTSTLCSSSATKRVRPGSSRPRKKRLPGATNSAGMNDLSNATNSTMSASICLNTFAQAILPVPSVDVMVKVGVCVTGMPVTQDGFCVLVAAIDFYTRWPEARALKECSPESVGQFILEEIICRHACVKIHLHSQDSSFVDRVYTYLRNLTGREQNLVGVHHPGPSSLITCLVNNLKDIMIMHMRNGRKWTDYLATTLFSLRTCKSTLSMKTPYEVLYKKNADQGIVLLHNDCQPPQT